MILNGRYRLENIIGQGGMGIVYAATDLESNETVAIKKLHRRHMHNDEIRDRFHREAKITKRLIHDGICPVTEIDTSEQGDPYFVMPLLKGKSLATLIRNESAPVPMSEISSIVCRVLDILAFAHEHGVLHRDIKPNNIFVCDDPADRSNVMLLDFGISKVSEVLDFSDAITATGTIVGTPHYMAPEQARGAKSLDNRIDIYAVGVLLYEALTQTKPFEGDTYNEIIIKLVSEPFVPPTQLNPEISVQLENVIIKAMSRHPDDRYATAALMRDAIERAAGKAATSELVGWNEETIINESGVSPCTPRKRRIDNLYYQSHAAVMDAVSAFLFGGLLMSHLVFGKTVPAEIDDTEQTWPIAAAYIPHNAADRNVPIPGVVGLSRESIDISVMLPKEDAVLSLSPPSISRRRQRQSKSPSHSRDRKTEPADTAVLKPPAVRGRLGTRIVSTF